MSDRDIESIDEKLRKVRRLDAMGRQLDEMIKALDEIEFSIDNILENDRCHACGKYALKPREEDGETVLRCEECGLQVEISEDML